MDCVKTGGKEGKAMRYNEEFFCIKEFNERMYMRRETWVNLFSHIMRSCIGVSGK